MLRIIFTSFFFFITFLNANLLQEAIDNAKEGSILKLPKGVYKGSIVINKGITFKNGFFPIVSKKDTDAFTLFDRHIVKPFNELPKHLQPQRVGEINPKKELIFSSPKKKLTTNNRSDVSDDGLDTLITFYATTIDAYDGTQVTYSINDEIGKMKGGLDINVYWEQAHKMCHEVGSNVRRVQDYTRCLFLLISLQWDSLMLTVILFTIILLNLS